MANANIVELNQTLVDLVKYCADAPQSDYVQEYCKPVSQALEELQTAVETTDRYFTKWSHEMGQDMMAWKNVAKELASTQAMLKRINAIGYPDKRVLYWDLDILQQAVQQMVNYLEQRRDHIPFANEQLEKFDRLTSKATGEDIESATAQKDYQRFIQLRANAMINASKVIAAFRVAMRRDLGREHADYKKIRWPFSVAPDEYVL